MQLTIPNTFTNGTEEANVIDAPKMNANFAAVATVLNGNIEADNIKTGAAIAIKNIAQTISAAWTFSENPVLNAAAIPDAALQANVMLKTAYDTDADGKVESADNADTATNADKLDDHEATYFATADHNHDATYAPIAKGVTNGDSHDHSGGDGAAIPEGGLSLSDVATGDVGTAKHGFCPKAPNDTTKFLRGDATWNVPPYTGYALPTAGAFLTTIADGGTYYVGSCYSEDSSPVPQNFKMYVPKAGTLKAAYLNWNAVTAGSGENISVYIRLNGATDTLVATVGNTDFNKLFSNTGLSIAVAQGDYIMFKIVCPTWGTNPANVTLGGVVYIE